MASHSNTLAWKSSMDRGAWWAAVHGVAQSWTRLSDFTFTFHLHALEKEMATHSNILAWRISWAKGPHGLQSMGSHRVGHNCAEDSATLEPESPAKLRSLSYRAGGYGPRHSSLNGSMVGCSPWGRSELDTTERFPFHCSVSCIGE